MTVRARVPSGAGTRKPRPDDEREQLFRELIALEREQTGSPETVDYGTRRQTLIDAIVRLGSSR